MAEHQQHGQAELGAPMDYPEHERTYSAFLTLSKVSVLASIATLLALALFSFGGSWGFWWGLLILILTALGTVIGIAGKGSVRPLGIVCVIGFILMALTGGS